MAKQTTITIETSSLLIIESRNSMRAFCTQCCAETEMIGLSKQDLSTFAEWVGFGYVHRSEDRDGRALICLNSVLARMNATKTASCGLPQLPNTEKERS